MLVVKLYKNQRLRIGDDVEIVIVDCDPAKVRLGIEAPKHIDISRDNAVKAPPHMRRPAVNPSESEIPY